MHIHHHVPKTIYQTYILHKIIFFNMSTTLQETNDGMISFDTIFLPLLIPTAFKRINDEKEMLSKMANIDFYFSLSNICAIHNFHPF